MSKHLLVIDHNYGRDWSVIFHRPTLANGEEVIVHQAGWQDIQLQCSTSEGCQILLQEKERPILRSQKNDERFSPDFLLIRNFPADLHGSHFKNLLYGFMFAGLILGGPEHFPIIQQCFYANIPSSHKDLIPEPTFPVVAKIGTVHAGYGKMRLQTEGDFSDFQSCMMLHRDYYITEPFLDVDYDLRLQYIGGVKRVYRRSSELWKQNWGEVKYENIDEYPEHYDLWMDEIAQFFGGLDMFALDVLRLKDGSDVILELNDTAMGLMFENEAEDNVIIRDMIIAKMNIAFPPAEEEEQGEG